MKDPRAIVLVTTSFPIHGDGSEAAGSFVSDLAEELVKHVPVRIVAPGEVTRIEHWGAEIDIFRFAAPDKPLSTLNPWRPSELHVLQRVLSEGRKATSHAAQAGPAAHILALWALPSGHWAYRASRQTSIPYSVWTLGSDIWTLGRVPLVRSYMRSILRNAHRCYSDGLKLANDTRAICGCDVEFLPSTRRIGRERTARLKSAPPYSLLFLGRWHPNKGIDLLIESLKLLNGEDWSRIESVEICGGGPLEQLVMHGVTDLRRSGRPVHMRGYLDKSSAEEAILRADYLLIPSRVESIPLVFSDAVKLSSVVVASPVGDLPELIEALPKSGIVADSVSPEAFARAIAGAVRACPEQFRNGLAGAKAKFSLETTARRIHADLARCA